MRKSAILLLVLWAFPAWAVTLDQCITTALDSNPDAQAVEQRVEAARKSLKEAQSGYYPWVYAAGNIARSDNPPQAFMMSLNQRSLNMADPTFNPNQPDDTENLRATLGIQYRLLDGGRRSLDNQMAGLGAEAAQENLAAVQNQLIHEVTRGYYSVLQADGFVMVQEESVKSLEESLRVAKERFNAGSTVKTDVLNLEVQLAQAREDLIRARNGLQMAIAALNTAIGQDLITVSSWPEPEDATDRVLPADEDPDAIDNRPEIKAAKKMADIKESAHRRAQRDYAPTLNAFGSSDWDSDVSTDFEQSYFVGVMAELNIFDGFKTRSATAKTKAEAEAARQDLQKARNYLKLDLKQAQLTAHEAKERMDVSNISLESAQEALRITQEQYQQGAADITILLTAQVGQTAMRTRFVAARYDFLIALSNLERAKGELVKKYKS